MTIADLFKPAPAHWGLRGDPHLWDDLAEALAGRALPPTAEELGGLLEGTIARLLGTPLVRGGAPVFVERYRRGGMSSGGVSPDFWLDTALPLLLARHARATGAAALGGADGSDDDGR